MPWQLDIHLIDVGQGDSTLIIARNTDPGGQWRSMLIDAGLSAYAGVVDEYISDVGPPRIHHFVSTHYDDDHRAGLEALLLADNLSNLVTTLAFIGAPAAVLGANRVQRIGSAAAAVYSAALGNFGPHSGRAATTATLARQNIANATGVVNDKKAVDLAVAAAELRGGVTGVASLISYTVMRRRAARVAGLAAAASIAAGNAVAQVETDIRDALLADLRKAMRMKEARFWTANTYNRTHVIDLGPADEPDGWGDAITGDFTLSTNRVRIPYPNRTRSTPALQDEVLWNSGPNAVLPPAGAPTAHVVSCDGLVWQGDGIAPERVTLAPGGNSCSIGLLIRFNNFAYYTAGDLASVGEDPLMEAIMSEDMPLPGGLGVVPAPDRVASFKCSHHGAVSSTSEDFLSDAKPSSALISCGANASYEHPSDEVVSRLFVQPHLTGFFLTNCAFKSAAVVASYSVNQLTEPGNTSFVAGDNNANNLAPGRHRGDIHLRVTQAESLAAQGAGRQHRLRYWEPFLAPVAGFRTVVASY